jgi:hypothetical protein
MHWNSTEDCEYPICDADEAVPVWVVVDDEVIDAWYRNPEMNVFWFEDDIGKEVEATLWIETLSLVGKPELPF